MSRKERFHGVALSAVVFMATVFAVTTVWGQQMPAKPEKTFKLTWISTFPKTHSVTVGFQKGFVDKAVELSKGRLVFDHKGGPETIPFADTGKAIQNKVVDMGICSVGYFEQIAPGMGGAILREISLEEERKPGGAFDYMVELCKVGNLRYLGRNLPCNDLSFFGIFSRKKIEKPDDFAGYRMGTTPATSIAAAAWGATRITLGSPADYYTSMERGTVDGICSTTAEQIVASGTFRVTKFAPRPGFFDGSGSVLMNMKVWNSLPADLQQVITQAMVHCEKYNADLHQEVIDRAYKKMSDSGVQVYDFSPDVGKWMRDKAYDSTWADQVKRFPKQASGLKELLSPTRK
ncbi:MAG: TRAP transporter substrate-binding protein DctP [Thermodesulfobacteriota bacterium]